MEVSLLCYRGEYNFGPTTLYFSCPYACPYASLIHYLPPHIPVTLVALIRFHPRSSSHLGQSLWEICRLFPTTDNVDREHGHGRARGAVGR